MPLKNYTSTVSASRSINFIEKKLALHGARKIMKEYGPDMDGRVIGIAFIIEMDGTEVPFKVPARVEQCERILLEMRSSKAQAKTRERIPEQAERTAWKIVSDWVEAQMAMIDLAQVEFLEVFLPYVYDPIKDRTHFEALKSSKFRALLPAPK